MTRLANNNNNKQQQEVTGKEMAMELDSPVKQMFTGRSVFITGASGFIGRVLLEKLLRCYPKIKNIYILMRTKKNQNPYDRLHKQLLNVPIFDKIRSMKNGQELLDKIVVIPGDIGDSWLGISDSNLDRLFKDDSLSIVFHSAATIKFDEPLKVSVRLNLIATRTVIDFCRRLPKLISLCHVSTCYANSDILEKGVTIEEKIYPLPDEPKDLMQLADLLDEDLMQNLKRSMVRARPNTYTYTKAMAEKYIQTEATDLPVAIVRPSIVVGSWKDPVPGWIDNLNGPTGLVLAIGKGLLRSLYAKTNAKADIIPVDIVVNSMVAAAYYAARAHNKFQPISVVPAAASNLDQSELATTANNQQTKQTTDACQEKMSSQESEALSLAKPPIFQINSGDLNPITWGRMESFLPIIREYPSCQVLRYPYGTFKNNKWQDMITRLFVHYLPALIIDLFCLVTGQKRQLLSIYFKLHAAVAALSHFMTHSYNFSSANLAKLRAILNEEDSQVLFMDIENLDWRQFWASYCLGARRYILRESDDSLEQARRSFRRSRYIELGFRTILVLMLAVCMATLLRPYQFTWSSLVGCSAADLGSSSEGIEPLVAASHCGETCYNQSSPILSVF